MFGLGIGRSVAARESAARRKARFTTVPHAAGNEQAEHEVATTAVGSIESSRSMRPTVAGQQAAHVLDPEVALDQRLDEIAERRADHEQRTGERRPPTTARRASAVTVRTPVIIPATKEPAKPSHDFFGLIDGAIG